MEIQARGKSASVTPLEGFSRFTARWRGKKARERLVERQPRVGRSSCTVDFQVVVSQHRVQVYNSAGCGAAHANALGGGARGAFFEYVIERVDPAGSGLTY